MNKAPPMYLAWGQDADLAVVVREHYKSTVSASAANSMRNSTLARAIRAEDDVGIATSNPRPAVRSAYMAVQAQTNEKHRQINEAIVMVLTEQLDLDLGKPEYEHRPFADARRRSSPVNGQAARPQARKRATRASSPRARLSCDVGKSHLHLAGQGCPRCR
jgi:hypothetical protein